VIVAHLDCSSGVSGDKFLGALLDVGTQTGAFTAEDLSKLAAALAPEAQVDVGTTSSYGIAATTLKVKDKIPHQHKRDERSDTCANSRAECCEAAEQVRNAETQNEECLHSAEVNVHGRSWAGIRASIEALPADVLSEAARNKAVLVFSELARVEAQIHGSTPDDIHFHEIGAADSIVDIVGACAALDALNITKLYATPPALGSGTVDTQHGILPVPAPATAALLLGIPTSMSAASGELTTPTGAALLKLAAGFGPVPPLTPLHIGYGAGTRDIGQPNICRILIGQLDEAAQQAMGFLSDKDPSMQEGTDALSKEKTVLLETNIDHIAPEAVAFAGEQLLAEGALDVWVTPIAMKKSRAALTLSLLASTSEAEHFAARMMKLTGTLGVRASIQPRYIAERESATVDTKWGPVQVKIGAGRVRPEHEDIARIAREHNLDYVEVLEGITASYKRK